MKVGKFLFYRNSHCAIESKHNTTKYGSNILFEINIQINNYIKTNIIDILKFVGTYLL